MSILRDSAYQKLQNENVKRSRASVFNSLVASGKSEGEATILINAMTQKTNTTRQRRGIKVSRKIMN